MPRVALIIIGNFCLFLNAKTHHRRNHKPIIRTGILQHKNTSEQPQAYRNERNTCEKNAGNDNWDRSWSEGHYEGRSIKD
jgi:hypothetical protein